MVAKLEKVSLDDLLNKIGEACVNEKHSEIVEVLNKAEGLKNGSIKVEDVEGNVSTIKEINK